MSRRTPALLAGFALLAVVGSARADEKAFALFQKAREAVGKATTMQADLVYTAQIGAAKPGFKATVRLMKPNYGYVDLRGDGGRGQTIATSDGKTSFTVDPSSKTYEKSPALANGIGFLSEPSPGAPNAPIVAFFHPESVVATPEHHTEVPRQVDGKRYQVVSLALKSEQSGTMRYLFAPGGLLEGVEMEMTARGQPITASFWLKNIKLDAPMKVADFAYKPPADFKVNLGPEGMLLPVGKKAPDFRLPVPGGGDLSLTAARDGKKAVLVNFWFYG